MAPLTVDELRVVFDNLDKNGDGILSLEELSQLLEMIDCGSSLSDLESFVGKPSLDFGDFLHFYESIDSLRDQRSVHGGVGGDGDEGGEHEDDLMEAFRVFDLNGDGFISSEELQDVLPRLGFWNETSGRDFGRMINAYDTDRDGRLDFEEFKNMMLSS